MGELTEGTCCPGEALQGVSEPIRENSFPDASMRYWGTPWPGKVMTETGGTERAKAKMREGKEMGEKVRWGKARQVLTVYKAPGGTSGVTVVIYEGAHKRRKRNVPVRGGWEKAGRWGGMSTMSAQAEKAQGESLAIFGLIPAENGRLSSNIQFRKDFWSGWGGRPPSSD